MNNIACLYILILLYFQTREVRHISHLNFTAWPDHDTPSQPDDLLTFISYMRHVHRSGPVITHCSAGIGRSGTLICIDVVLGLISQDLEVRTRRGWAKLVRALLGHTLSQLCHSSFPPDSYSWFLSLFFMLL